MHTGTIVRQHTYLNFEIHGTGIAIVLRVYNCMHTRVRVLLTPPQLAILLSRMCMHMHTKQLTPESENCEAIGTLSE